MNNSIAFPRLNIIIDFTLSPKILKDLEFCSLFLEVRFWLVHALVPTLNVNSFLNFQTRIFI